MAIAEKLSKLSKSWKKVQPIQASFSSVPDGDYVADLKEMKLEESKKSDRLQVVSTFEIADGEQEGQLVKRFDGVDQEQSMGYFKGYSEVIGLELPDDMELLQEAIDEFIGNNSDLFNIRVVTNGQYQNVYIQGVSEYTKGEAKEEKAEEPVEEVVVEEQEVIPPKKFVKKLPVTKPTFVKRK